MDICVVECPTHFGVRGSQSILPPEKAFFQHLPRKVISTKAIKADTPCYTQMELRMKNTSATCLNTNGECRPKSVIFLIKYQLSILSYCILFTPLVSATQRVSNMIF
ncbi:hypothetical protein EDEG_01014 [Edhazardia aedis USNM 41457]|uniref:Uncharacterized protein n=1 Tax=Edhazardia aedis (strain USNM 41457) TaxID=1003232 RepID=J9DU19_EDHAE|nr:hypothetical protein EDEG_01014 [Edhazardia aedis USNM 41457]|eukprot:EJW04792.1 hypothetical protein EDEG_01014 [Edhazardia aedis USNM 41457]